MVEKTDDRVDSNARDALRSSMAKLRGWSTQLRAGMPSEELELPLDEEGQEGERSGRSVALQRITTMPRTDFRQGPC